MAVQLMDVELERFYSILRRRKSLREFSVKAIEPEKIDRLMAVLQRAQSAANRQPWHFILVENKYREALNEVFTKEGFKDAPVAVVACADRGSAWTRRVDGVNYAWVDVTIAVTEMITAATAEGLGTCWIAAIDPARVKAILNIPAAMDVVAVIALGYAKEPLAIEEKNRKPLKEIIHHGRW
ncbi:MAG: nitroreductase family protein [Thermodesulfobacteriota bacterium]